MGDVHIYVGRSAAKDVSWKKEFDSQSEAKSFVKKLKSENDWDISLEKIGSKWVVEWQPWA